MIEIQKLAKKKSVIIKKKIKLIEENESYNKKYKKLKQEIDNNLIQVPLLIFFILITIMSYVNINAALEMSNLFDQLRANVINLLPFERNGLTITKEIIEERGFKLYQHFTTVEIPALSNIKYSFENTFIVPSIINSISLISLSILHFKLKSKSKQEIFPWTLIITITFSIMSVISFALSYLFFDTSLSQYQIPIILSVLSTSVLFVIFISNIIYFKKIKFPRKLLRKIKKLEIESENINMIVEKNDHKYKQCEKEEDLLVVEEDSFILNESLIYESLHLLESEKISPEELRYIEYIFHKLDNNKKEDVIQKETHEKLLNIANSNFENNDIKSYIKLENS